MTIDIPLCLAPTRTPHPPASALPPGAVDTHVHVFDSRYPLSPARGYTPPDSTLEHLRAMHTAMGIDRVVLTQPSIYGTDNSAILDAMDALNAETPDRARAVVAVSLEVTEAELVEMDERGVRGVRLNTDNKGGMPLEMDDVPRLCDRIGPLGWHVEFLFPGADIVSMMPLFESLAVPMSIAHFAYQAASDGVDSAGFEALLELVAAGNTWLKISGADRVTTAGPPDYDDVAPLARALLAAGPERIMWGTDWPHPNKYEMTPDDGDLVDVVNRWLPDDGLRTAVLVDNPAAFYRF